nr:MAG TPA: hypothetical protein [Caudoviricetes sp.]
MRNSKLDKEEILETHCHYWAEPYSVESHKI